MSEPARAIPPASPTPAGGGRIAQGAILALSLVTALSQQSDAITGLLPPKVAVLLMAVANLLSAVLPPLVAKKTPDTWSVPPPPNQAARKE
jgi:hypothetical protein